MDLFIKSQRIHINVPSWAALEERVADRLARREGFALATINLDHLVKLRTSDTFRAAYARHDLVVADGNPIVWMSELAGKPVELIPGSDAILPLARIAARQGVSLALVGSTEESLSASSDYLTDKVPGLKIAVRVSPPFGFDPQGAAARDVLRKVEESGAGLCFIALGAPKQEMLAALGREITPGVGYASIGAGLDFFAGTQARAPLWARQLAMEWLWRALSSPRRLGPRYLRCMAILPREMANALMQRLSARHT